MQTLTSISVRELEQLQERLRRLAREKSNLQLVNNMMNSLSAESGLEKTVEKIAGLILENVGGSNVAIYYQIESKIHVIDVFGNKAALETVDDEMVRRVFASGEFIEEFRDFAGTAMTTPEFTKASFWALPLKVGERTIGVLKMEGMIVSMAEVRCDLQPFFNYAALVLKSEIESYSMLMEAYDQLKAMNEDFKNEMRERQRQQKFLEAVLDSTEAGIAACDNDGFLTLFNRKSRELHVLPFERLLADQWAEHYGMYLPDGKTLMSEKDVPLLRALRGERVTSVEMVLRPPNTEPRRLLVSGRTIRDKDGVITGAVVAMHDVTERKALEAQLFEAQKLEAIAQLAAGMAHEINTPAQFVRDNVQFLKDALEAQGAVVDSYRTALAATGRPELLEQVRGVEAKADLGYVRETYPGAVKETLDGLSRIATIVQAMKEFVRPERQARELVYINGALENALTVAHHEYSHLADIKRQFGELPPVLCYSSDLNQVFLNLIVNAAHAIGKVVRSSGERGRITVRTQSDQEFVRIDIEDTGCGIPEAIRHRVFELFFTTEEVGKGIGRGLAMAWTTVVKKHCGRLTFVSEIGKGTTFTVQLPRKPAEEEQVAS